MKSSIAILAGLLLGCSGPANPSEEISETQAPITQGIPDEGDPGVVGLVRHGKIFCTGALVTDSIVLTAAHCLDGLLGRPDMELEVQSGPTVEQPEDIAVVIEARAHPEFDPVTLDHDLALLRITPPLPGPVRPLPEAPLTDADVGAGVRIVGFGKTSPEDVEAPRKRQGTAVIAELADETFTVSAAPSQPCHMDSGGPALLSVEGREILVGITRSGDAACQDFGRYTRVDAYDADFITPAIDALLADPREAASVGCALHAGSSGSSGALWLCLGLVVCWPRRHGLQRGARRRR